MRKRPINGKAELRDTPASDTELARILRYREAGSSPGNPKWYKPLKVRPYVFEPNLPAHVPAWTRPVAMNPQEFSFPTWTEDMSAAEYIEQFDRFNGPFKPVKVEWIKVPDGNYA